VVIEAELMEGAWERAEEAEVVIEAELMEGAWERAKRAVEAMEGVQLGELSPQAQPLPSQMQRRETGSLSWWFR